MHTQGLATNGGGTIALSGGTFDNNNQPLTNSGAILGSGTLRTGGLTNNGAVSFADAPTNVLGAVTNANSLKITNNTTTFFGTITNAASGTIQVTSGAARFLSTFTNNGTLITDPSTNYFTDLVVGPSGSISAASGDQYLVGGNFTNNSTQTGTWNTSGALLGFQGGVSHQLSVARSACRTIRLPGTLQVNAGDSVSVKRQQRDRRRDRQ